MEFSYLGRGIYTISEASRLTKINSRSISRWVRGYAYQRDSEKKQVAPVFRSDFQPIDGRIAISFLDLIEVRFISAFRSLGVSWRTIKIALLKAQEVLQEHYPFSSKKFLTDGREILYRVQEECGDSSLMNLVTDQYELERLLEKYLKEGLEYTPEDLACRWWPTGKDSHIVIDPSRSFGQPIINDVNIPTSTLYSAFLAEHSTESVASWFEIDETLVDAAVEYEQSLALA